MKRSRGSSSRIHATALKLHTLQAQIRDHQRGRIDEIHALCHEFMRDMDRAILIHEQLAVLEGRDPKAVTKALWPVRTQRTR